MSTSLPPEKHISANLATQLFGFAGFPAILSSFFIVNRFGKRQLLLAGWLGITFVLGTLVLSILLKNGYLALFCICFFQFVYNWSIGAVHWFYLPEVLNDQ